MRVLIYKEPIRVDRTTISNAFLNNNSDERYYERALSITTRFGLVNVYDFHWQTNFGFDSWAQFETIIDGYKYYATINESRMSDRQLKWLATNFMKTIFNKLCGK